MPYSRDIEAIRIGKRILEARLNAGLTQRNLAEQLGCTHQTVAKYESGQSSLSAVLVLEIARILNIPIQQLFGDCPLLAA